jgi:glycosyltransferase involved in cell wall biosynthesis
MRILFIMISSYSPLSGGAEKYMIELAGGLAARGHGVFALCSHDLQCYFEAVGVTAESIDIGPKLAKRNAVQLLALPWMVAVLRRRIRKLLGKRPFDVIHVHFKKEQILAGILGRQLNIPVVWTEHAPLHSLILDHWLPLKIYNWAASGVKTVITVGDTVRDSLIAAGLPPEKIVRIYNGIHRDFFRRCILPIPAECRQNIAVVGRLHEDKGHHYLFQAFSQVLWQFSGARLFVVGDGVLRSSLERCAKNLSISTQVRFLGQIPPKRVIDVLDSTGVSAMPSLGEGLPYSIVEAMARGRPVVATRVGGVPEMVAEGKTGFVVSPKNPDGLAGAILQVLTNPHLQDQMGYAGRERALRDFTYDNMLDLTEDVYSHLRDSKARKGN